MEATVLVKPSFVRGDHVHVALDDDRGALLADGVAGQVVAVQKVALGEDLGVASVQVLRFDVAQGAAAEAHDRARPVPDGEDQAVEQVVADSAFVGAGQASGFDGVVLEVKPAQVGQEWRTVRAGVAQPELRDRLVRKPPSPHVYARFLGGR